MLFACIYPDSNVHGANMGPIWGRQDPGGPHVGPMDFAIWVCYVAAELWQNVPDADSIGQIPAKFWLFMARLYGTHLKYTG